MMVGRAVRTYLDHLSVERGLAANTLSSYRRDLRRYAEFLEQSGVTELGEVTEQLVATGSGTPALFLNARGGRLSRQSAWTVLVKAADRAGVTRDVSPHTMRHSFATHPLDGGADVRVVQELLGHASVTTTQVYTLVTVDNLREVFATAHPRARG